MNILEKKCLLDGVGGSSSTKGTELNESYYVKFDEVLTNASDAIIGSGFFCGDAHPTITALSLATIDAESISGQEWILNLNYSTEETDDNSSSGGGAGGGTDFKTDVNFGKWTYQRVVSQDKETGDPIVNKAGEPFDTPVVEEISCPIISVTRRKTSPNMEIIQNIGYINSQAFSLVGIDIPKYCAQLSNYTIERFQEQDFTAYYIQTFEFKLNFKKSKDTGETIGFKAEVANVGFNYEDENGGPLKEILINNSPVTTPQFLDENGRYSSTNRPAPNYIQFVVNDLFDFKTYNLPSAYPRY